MMKALNISTILRVATIVATATTTANAACPFCPNGMTVEFPDCTEVAADALLIDENSDECTTEIKPAEQFCCPPPPEDPCNICPNGISLAEDLTAFISEEDIQLYEQDCQFIVEFYAATAEKGSEVCSSEAELNKSTCCPAVPDVPCEFCPDGFTTLTGGIKIEACEQLVLQIAKLEDGSEMCESEKSTQEPLCCPTTTTTTTTTADEGDDFFSFANQGDDFFSLGGTDNPCNLCPNGFTIGNTLSPFLNETEIQDLELTCELSAAFATLYEEDSEECNQLKATCCPTPATNPCTICPDGVTAVDDGGICETVSAQYALYETDSEFCEESLVQSYQRTCCPSPVDNPCPFCPNGITVANDFAGLLNETEQAEAEANCQVTLEFVSGFDADSEECVQFMEGQLGCCPSEVKPVDSCTLCDGAAAVNEDFEIFADFTCSNMIVQASFFAADTQDCKFARLNEVLCCPTPAATPCEICPDGSEFISDAMALSHMDDDFVEDIDLSCSQGASYIEDGSDMCDLAKEEFSPCCAFSDDDPLGIAIPPIDPTTPVDNPCRFCPNGITVEDDFAGFLNETELAEAVAGCQLYLDITPFLEADSEECAAYLDGQMGCCPGDAVSPEDSCKLCDGVAVNEDFKFAGGFTCAQFIQQASFISDPEECKDTSLYEVLCCPILASTPCEVCPDGYEFVSDAFPLEEEDDDFIGSVAITCSEGASYIEDGSDMCELAKGEFQSACCVPLTDDSQQADGTQGGDEVVTATPTPAPTSTVSLLPQSTTEPTDPTTLKPTTTPTKSMSPRPSLMTPAISTKPTAASDVTNPIFAKSSKLLKGIGHPTKAAKSKGGKSSKAAKSIKEFVASYETISRPSSKSAKGAKSSKKGKGSTKSSKANTLGLNQLERTADHYRANGAGRGFCYGQTFGFGLVVIASLITIWC